MYEPKYKLNKKDDVRYNELLVRHCLEASKKPHRKYPPLTSEENEEFERLDRKRHRILTLKSERALTGGQAGSTETKAL